MPRFHETELSDVSKQLNVLFPKEVAEKLAVVHLLDETEGLNELLKLSEIKTVMFKKPFIPPPGFRRSSMSSVSYYRQPRPAPYPLILTLNEETSGHRQAQP